MLTSSVMLDLIIGVIVVLSVWLGGKHGLFRTLAELAAYVAAYAASALLSGRVAGMAVEWIRPLAESKLQVIVDEYFSGLRQELPAYLDIGELVEAARNELDIGPLIEQGMYNLSYMLCAVVIFLVVLVILRLIIRALDLVTKLPVIHQFNTLGGLLIGGAKGVLLVTVILLLARQTGLLVSPAAMSGSYFVPILQKFLPL